MKKSIQPSTKSIGKPLEIFLIEALTPWVGLDLASTPGADVAITGDWELNLAGLDHESAAQRTPRRGRKVQPYIEFWLSLDRLTRRPIATIRQ